MVTANGQTILLEENDPEVRSYLETVLKCQGYKVELAEDGDEVLACLQANEGPISAILLEGDGLAALKEIRRANKEIPVIIMSGVSSSLNIAQAMKCGANDFVSKPVHPEDLRRVLSTVTSPPRTPERPCQPELKSTGDKHLFFSAAPSMRELQRLIAQVAWSDAPVLIQGETGAGKEVFARELHLQSKRSKRAFMKLNCAALPSELVESELFGYERGAFTGAFQKKLGIFELASGGTLLLDEIGDMDVKLQAKLLQVLQDQEFQRLGGKEIISVNVRIIAATHRNLVAAISQNMFREDLYHRLNVIRFRIPPLRERKQDIIALAEFFIKKHSALESAPVTLTEPLKELLLAYSWPGNIRELENVIRQYIVFREVTLFSSDLKDRIQATQATSACGEPLVNESHDLEPKSPALTLPTTTIPTDTPSVASVLQEVARAKQDAERAAILGALKSTRWNRKKAAQLLNVDYKALLYKMKKLSIKKHPSGSSATDLLRSPKDSTQLAVFQSADLDRIATGPLAG